MTVIVLNKHTFCFKPYASVKSSKEGPTLEYYEKLTTKFISDIYNTVPWLFFIFSYTNRHKHIYMVLGREACKVKPYKHGFGKEA